MGISKRAIAFTPAPLLNFNLLRITSEWTEYFDQSPSPAFIPPESLKLRFCTVPVLWIKPTVFPVNDP